MSSALHCQFVVFRIFISTFGLLPHTKEGELTKNAFLIVRWLIACFCPFWERKNVEKTKNKKLKINDVCSYCCALTSVCVCTTCVRLRANLALSYEKMRFRLCVASLSSWRQGPKRDCIDYRLCLPIWQPLAAQWGTTGGQRLCCRYCFWWSVALPALICQILNQFSLMIAILICS